MTIKEREALQLRIIDALDTAMAMTEGRPHKKTKSRAVDALGLHFRSTGRVVYLAEEMTVLYPGEPGFCPDVLAVLDVEEPEDDQRMCWVVADEGKGLDLVIEVLHRGDRRKDLVHNVERYAHLGIPEYFIYDRALQQIHGYRLPPGAARYQRVVPQLGHYHSNVLGLDLAIIGDNLQFLVGEARLPDSPELIGRLRAMLESETTRAEQAQAEQAQAAQAQAQVEQAQAEQAQVEPAQAQARARAVLMVLRVRGIEVPDAQRERVLAERDGARLDRWLEKAVVVASLDDVLDEAG